MSHVDRFRWLIEGSFRDARKAARSRVDEELQVKNGKKSVSKAIRKHWDRVANLGCIITGQPAEVAHCHGGSISVVLGAKFRPGMAQKQNHWLVIPLNPQLHRGQFGLDSCSADDWEAAYGEQVHLLEEVSYRLGYDVFKKAGVENYVYRAFHTPAA